MKIKKIIIIVQKLKKKIQDIKIKVLGENLFVLLIEIPEKEEAPEKVRDLELTVVAKENLPEELLQIVESKKATPFKFTFNDGEYLYICVGYGEQESGGYSITVEDLYLTQNAIYAKTCLIGPGPDVPDDGVYSYPYIVLKTEYLDYSVVFD